MPFRHYEDFAEGEEINLGSYRVNAAEIIEFAEEFDPAPFHLSEDGGKSSMHGRLIASGWHTCAITQKLLCDGMLLESSCQGSPGVDKVSWLRPVFPDDTLQSRGIVVSKRLSASRPGMGLVSMRIESFTNSSDPVLTLQCAIIFATRPADTSSRSVAG